MTLDEWIAAALKFRNEHAGSGEMVCVQQDEESCSPNRFWESDPQFEIRKLSVGRSDITDRPDDDAKPHVVMKLNPW